MEQLSFADLMETIRKQRVFIVAVTVLVMFLAGARLYFLVPQEWSAATTIIFEHDSGYSPGSLAQLMYAARIPGAGGVSSTFRTVLRSRKIRERVAEKMDLLTVLGMKSVRAAAGRLGPLYDIEMTATGIMTIRTEWEGPPKALSGGAEEDEAPELAAELANTLVEALGEFLNEADYSRATRLRKFLEEQLVQIEAELLEAEDALVVYASQHRMVSPSTQSGAVFSRYNDLRQRESNLRVNLRGAQQTEQEALEHLHAQERMAISAISETRNPRIDALQKRILDLQRQIAQQTEVEGKSHDHPDVQRLQTELEKAEDQLADELSEEMFTSTRQFTIDPSYGKLVATALSERLQRSGLEAQLDAVRVEKERALAELSTMPSLSAQYDHLQRQVRLKTEQYSRLSENYEAARLAEAGRQDQFSVLDAAIAPRGPSGPFLVRGLLATGFVTFVLATVLAFWREGRRGG